MTEARDTPSSTEGSEACRDSLSRLDAGDKMEDSK